MQAQNRQTGLVLIVLGVIFLAMQFWGTGSLMAYGWPLFIILPGAALMWQSMGRDGINTEGFVGGSVVTATGLLLALMNITGKWEAWAYAWGIYPVVTGAALMYVGRRNDHAELAANGFTTLKTGVLLLVGFGIFFEVFIFGGYGAGINWNFWPLFLIGLGIFIFLRGNTGSKNKRISQNDDTYDPIA